MVYMDFYYYTHRIVTESYMYKYIYLYIRQKKNHSIRIYELKTKNSTIMKFISIYLSIYLSIDRSIYLYLSFDLHTNIYLGYGQRLQLLIQPHVRLDVNTTVTTHGQGRAQCFLCLFRPNRDCDDFARDLLFFQANAFFDRNFTKWVHAHLDIGQVHTRGRNTNFDRIVYDALDSHENLQQFSSRERPRPTPTIDIDLYLSIYIYICT